MNKRQRKKARRFDLDFWMSFGGGGRPVETTAAERVEIEAISDSLANVTGFSRDEMMNCIYRVCADT